MAIEPEAPRARAAFEFGLAKAGVSFAHVHHLPIHSQYRINVVEIRIVHVPEPRPRQRAGRLEDLCLAGSQSQTLPLHFGPLQPCPRHSVRIHDHRRQSNTQRLPGFVAHLRFHRHVAGFLDDGKMRRININARRLEILVKRQRLIDLAGQMQPGVVVQPAVIGIEVAPHPFVAHAGRLLPVTVAVVHFDRDEIVAVKIHQVGQVQAAGGDAVLEFAGGFSVDPKAAGLFHPFKLQEDFPALRAGRQLEMLAIPGEARVGAPVPAAVADDVPERSPRRCRCAAS